MSKLRTIYMHLKSQGLIVYKEEASILTAQEYLSLSSKQRREHRKFCVKNNIKIPI